MTEMNSWQDIIRRSGFIHDSPKGDPTFFGLAVGGQYNATNPTLTDGDWSTLQLDASGRVKCILDGATISLGGDLNVDVSAYINTSGDQKDAYVYTNGESLAAVSEYWQGFGGYDETGDKFYAFPINIDNAVIGAALTHIPIGGIANSTLPTYTAGDAALINLSLSGEVYSKSKLWDGTNVLDVLIQDSAYGTTSKGLAVFGKYEATPTSYTDGDAVPLAVDANGRLKLSDVDIQIGAVEIKNSTTDDRVIVKAGNTFATTDLSMGVADANVLSALTTTATAPSVFRSATVDETAAQAVKAGAGNVYGWNIYNPNSYDIFVKLYNTAAASVVMGTTTIVQTIQVPAMGSVMTKSDQPIQAFSTAIAIAATKLYADNDTTAIATDALVHIFYK